MALIANCNTSKGKRFKPSQFDPYAEAKKPKQMTAEEKEAAALAFMKSWK